MEEHSVIHFQHLLNLPAAIQPQGTTVLVLLLLLLLLLSFFISGAEVAFFSLTYKDINYLKTKQQQPSFKRIVELLEEPKSLLASMLITNSILNIGIIIISNFLLDELIAFEQFKLAWLELIIKIVVVTFILILFAEVMPKVMARQNNIRFAKDASFLIETIHYLFGSISKKLVKYSDVVEKKLAGKSDHISYSLEELNQAIEITTENTAAAEKEKNILKSIIKFRNITVKQIMKARLDVHGVDYALNFHELIKLIEELHYSRLPVYKDNLDTIAGVIHTKDVLPFIQQDATFEWQKLMRPPFFVHEQKMIEDLLQEFQSKRIHFAVVVDEFGGTSGIVTLEDILEEVIGDIRDEFDEEELPYKKIDDNNYLFEGKTMINDVCKFMDLPLDTFDAVRGESDSLAGLILEIAGKIPSVEEVVYAGDFEFKVLEMEKNRIQKIKITINHNRS